MSKKNTHPLFEIEGLEKCYKSPHGKLSILEGLDLKLEQGEMRFIVGKSGSGKSTLLHLMGGLDKPDKGKISFLGKNMKRMSDWRLARIRNRHIGFVFQAYHLLPELTVFENVLLPSIIRGKKQRSWTKELLRSVELYDRRRHYPAQLSGGEQQRVAIARSLVNRPDVVLCDEPTGNLDTQTAKQIMALLFDLNSKGEQAFVFVTHDEHLASQHKNTLLLKEGRLVPWEEDESEGASEIVDKIADF